MRTEAARRTAVIVLGLGAAFALGAALSDAQVAPVYNRPSAVSPPGDIARGKALSETCVACHGGDAPLQGDPQFHAPKLRYQRPSTIFYALQDYRSGQRKSDLMGSVAQALNDQDMRDLAAYLSARTVRSRFPTPPRAIADTPAHHKNSQICGMCHGETGLGEADGYPVLGGQHEDYIEHALREYRSGGRANPVMQRFARGLTPAEIHMMAAYFAGQVALEPVE